MTEIEKICKMCDNKVPKWRGGDEFCCDACKAADYVNKLFGKEIYTLKERKP